MRYKPFGFIYALALACFLGWPAFADDWPQWRGPQRDGVWRETGIVDKFTTDQLPHVWRAEIGSGYSGPSVADGRVFITDRIFEPESLERVHAFDARNGQPLWMHSYPCSYENVGYEAGPRASVSIADGRAFALGAMGHLHCFEAATGDILWKRDLQTEYGIRLPIWGIAASPLVKDGMVIVQIGGENGACLVAFDTETGDERWRSLGDRASYAAPILVEQAGREVLVCRTGDSVAGLDPADGTVHWRYPYPPERMVIAISTPVVDTGRVFVTSFYDGSLLLRLNSNQLAADAIWQRKGLSEQPTQTDALHSIISTPLFEGNHIYGVDSYGELRCLDANTGDRLWADTTATPRARWSNIHMVRHGEETWMFNERGELIISRLSPQGYQEISRAKLIEPTTKQLPRRGQGVCWAHPAFANRHVFARNDEALVCAPLAK